MEYSLKIHGLHSSNFFLSRFCFTAWNYSSIDPRELFWTHCLKTFFSIKFWDAPVQVRLLCCGGTFLFFSKGVQFINIVSSHFLQIVYIMFELFSPACRFFDSTVFSYFCCSSLQACHTVNSALISLKSLLGACLLHQISGEKTELIYVHYCSFYDCLCKLVKFFHKNDQNAHC